MGFKALENNADDPARFCRTAVEKVSGKYSRTQIMFDVRACCKNLRCSRSLASSTTGKRTKFPSYLFFQAETNVVIFSKTLHVESNTITVS